MKVAGGGVALYPGASLPAHDHPADEECLVLEGEVMLGDIVGRAGMTEHAA
jgi:quercetin dioxygenase-like cupin family protein